MASFTRGYLARVATVERTLACKLNMHAACERVGCPCLHHYPADRLGAAKAMARILGGELRQDTNGLATRGF